jgi:tyrosyl-tRNA synthetase
MSTNLLDDLEYRGLIYQMTDRDGLQRQLEGGPVVLYAGFDPTADSLHIGSLLPILCLRRFQLAGHIPIALVGGGTGLIGDPSGRSTERTLNTADTVAQWTESIRQQLSRFLDFDREGNPARMANNYDWLSPLNVIAFLRDVGKNFTVNYMLAKDSVDSRLAGGISFTEFSYMILQSYDYLQLYKEQGCRLQIGGSDQWGNITAGLELIGKTVGHEAGNEAAGEGAGTGSAEAGSAGGGSAVSAEAGRLVQDKAFGMTLPLVTKSDGKKFGKTESGAIWLDRDKTSPYQFYQFWINTDDNDVVRFLKYFTFLSREEIEQLGEEVKRQPEQRAAQKALAREVTLLVHGEDGLRSAENITAALFSGDVTALSATELVEAFTDVPSTELDDQPEIGLVDLLIAAKAAPSRRQARQDIESGAVYVNGERNADAAAVLMPAHRLHGKYIVLRRGKKNYWLVSFR